jgi:hypothetical protein
MYSLQDAPVHYISQWLNIKKMIYQYLIHAPKPPGKSKK